MFSFIIPAKNEVKFLPACIESIKKQQGGFGYEIIVVDNNSTDKTVEIAQNLGVKVIQEPRGGVGQARKTGTDMAMGDYIVNLDADSRLPHNYLLKVKKKFEEDKKLACLGGLLFFYDSSIWKYVFWCVILQPFLIIFVRLAAWGKLGPMGNNMVFKKDDYKKTNGFDPLLKFGEDGELSRQLSKLGKVKISFFLHCNISCRRFNLLDKNFWPYAKNFFKLCLK